ncbi:hypothetical protein AAFF_G00441570 [Aldrovandia affinis]|uniref:Uncharacterized protein n=1 Tax=Aldrovandia affinis TaxID=143900 RepID=A0AAD7S7N9_9TELE|nr:hypothetical protein AAFF_G00441570 [Aldrovandia affinis]
MAPSTAAMVLLRVVFYLFSVVSVSCLTSYSKEELLNIGYSTPPDIFPKLLTRSTDLLDIFVKGTAAFARAVRQRLKLSKPVVRRVKVWSSEARERLSAWLERAGCDRGLMEWAGPEAGNNLDEYTDTVTSFISFCEELCVPVRTRKIYNNDKPWFTAQLRRLRSEKEEARRSGDKDRFKEAKYRFAKAAKEAKHRFSEKLQQQFSEGNPASVWKGLKTITNYKPKSPQTSDNLSLANELNEFYCRFEKERFLPALSLHPPRRGR